MKTSSDFFCFLVLSIFISVPSKAQHVVSGYVNTQNSEMRTDSISLSEIQLNSNTKGYSETKIATLPINENGSFSFDDNLFSNQNKIYKIALTSAHKQKELSKSIQEFQLFIASKKDTLHFKKGERNFQDFTTSNSAHREFKKLKHFEARYDDLTTDFDPKQYLLETKGYVKDSLQILLVKLIGIKKLDDHNLLEKDIIENPKYYNNLISELKSSEIDPELYLYLENKMVWVTYHTTHQKYQLSMVFNILATILVLTLSGFTLFLYQKKSKPLVISPLSKQEQVIKTLIIEGKTNKEIANELFVSLNTVKTHITNIYNKLNISNRQELISKK